MNAQKRILRCTYTQAKANASLKISSTKFKFKLQKKKRPTKLKKKKLLLGFSYNIYISGRGSNDFQPNCQPGEKLKHNLLAEANCFQTTMTLFDSILFCL